MNRPRIILADDHTILTDALVDILKDHFDIAGVARNGRELITKVQQLRPDVIVADITMPELNGIDAARTLHKEASTSKLIFLTMHADLPLVEEAFRAGALGYVLKICPAEELIRAIQSVSRGARYITPLLAGDLISTLVTMSPLPATRETTLTSRQREVLQLLAEGKTMKEVAVQLGISTRTSESHKYEIMRLLGIQTTAELIRYAVRIKLV
ncbi:MAG TPA: response regulator transcription factor [Terriglobia bacterium]|jgi:DNA-binding NarL/FixJ family response regulator